ncbi:hypothetical protein [Tahibacter amnicola]|uniref:Uncharacterized protein n=1 Tax=Tahibacter amnicola TaxID=2976241 RepID=A0ABY6B7Y0_9GAMM|nr:hypothetical protein [Tahibacter amnicola]UXI65784.1 hypothetical protein N4264_13520 [Tahibacter amnicola]
MDYEPRFPAAIARMAAIELPDLISTAGYARNGGFVVTIAGEYLSAPYRIDYERHAHSVGSMPYRVRDRDRALRHLVDRDSEEARCFRLSLGTRHWDGRFREACAQQLAGTDAPWVLPFLLALLGDYVVEVANAAIPIVAHWDSRAMAAFARDNDAFVKVTKARAVSYWNCYYRRRWPCLADYPPIVALRTIEHLARKSRD